MTGARRCVGPLTIAVLAASACAPGPTVRPGRDRVIVGDLGTFSGPGSELGAGAARGIQIAVEEYNRDPDRTFEGRVVRADAKGTPDGAVGGARRLIATERLVGVVGPYRVEEAEAAGPLLDEAGVPFLVPSVTSASLSRFGWRTFRRLVADDRREGAALAAAAARLTRKGATAIFHDGNSAGVEFADGARLALEAARAPVVRVEGLPPKANLGSVAGSLMKDPPAAVLYGGAPDRAGRLLAALRSAGFKGRFVASHQAREPAFANAAGDAGAGALSACVCADPSDPALNAFTQAHRERFQGRPAPFAVEAYEGALMLLEAVEEAEAKPGAIAEFFGTARDFLGDSKNYEYEASGEIASPPVWVYAYLGGAWRFRGRSDRRAVEGAFDFARARS